MVNDFKIPKFFSDFRIIPTSDMSTSEQIDDKY